MTEIMELLKGQLLKMGMDEPQLAVGVYLVQFRTGHVYTFIVFVSSILDMCSTLSAKMTKQENRNTVIEKTLTSKKSQNFANKNFVKQLGREDSDAKRR